MKQFKLRRKGKNKTKSRMHKRKTKQFRMKSHNKRRTRKTKRHLRKTNQKGGMNIVPHFLSHEVKSTMRLVNDAVSDVTSAIPNVTEQKLPLR